MKLTKIGTHLFVLVALALVSVFSTAQTTHTHQHGTVNNMKVDGSQHPELIPDSVAYRLYFISLSNLSPVAQQARLRQVNLTADEIVAATAVLNTFKAQWDRVRNDYNANVEKLGGAADSASFIEQRDALVNATRNALRNVLSIRGDVLLEANLQDAKHHIKMTNPNVK